MRQYFLLAPLAATLLTGCDMAQRINASTCDIERNTDAIERSTEAINRNLQELNHIQRT